LFSASTYLALSKGLENLFYYRYTNFNFFEHWRLDLDILNYGRINILGFGLFCAIVLLMLIGLKVARKGYANKTGLLGFPFLFFLYQL